MNFLRIILGLFGAFALVISVRATDLNPDGSVKCESILKADSIDQGTTGQLAVEVEDPGQLTLHPNKIASVLIKAENIYSALLRRSGVNYESVNHVCTISIDGFHPLNRLSKILHQIGMPVVFDPVRTLGLGHIKTFLGPQLALRSTDIQLVDEFFSDYIEQARRARDLSDASMLFGVYVETGSEEKLLQNYRERYISSAQRRFRIYSRTHLESVTLQQVQKRELALLKMFRESILKYKKDMNDREAQKNLVDLTHGYLEATGVPNKIIGNNLEGFAIEITPKGEKAWRIWQEDYYQAPVPSEFEREMPDLVKLANSTSILGQKLRFRPASFLGYYPEKAFEGDDSVETIIQGFAIFPQYLEPMFLLSEKTLSLGLYPRSTKAPIAYIGEFYSSNQPIDMVKTWDLKHQGDLIAFSQIAVDQAFSLKGSFESSAFLNIGRYLLDRLGAQMKNLETQLHLLAPYLADLDTNPVVRVSQTKKENQKTIFHLSRLGLETGMDMIVGSRSPLDPNDLSIDAQTRLEKLHADFEFEVGRLEFAKAFLKRRREELESFKGFWLK